MREHPPSQRHQASPLLLFENATSSGENLRIVPINDFWRNSLRDTKDWINGSWKSIFAIAEINSNVIYIKIKNS